MNGIGANGFQMIYDAKHNPNVNMDTIARDAIAKPKREVKIVLPEYLSKALIAASIEYREPESDLILGILDEWLTRKCIIHGTSEPL